MRRGEIWTGNLNPDRGAEIGKVRPVLILQADWMTREAGLRTVVVLPLTSQVRPQAEPLRPIIRARDGLVRDSQVVVEQPRTLDQARMGEGPLATLTPAEMAAVERSLAAVLGLPSSEGT